MKIKKSRQPFEPRPDETLPDKADANPREALKEVPKYDGRPKSDKPRAPGRGKAKAEIDPQVTKRPRSPKEMTDLPDMKPPRRRGTRGREAGRPTEQYIRLRIRVRGDRMSVVDSHLVDGPLSSINAFPGNNAYEVTLGDRLLHAGALPDLGQQRSFVAPNPRKGEGTHHFADHEVFEFSARLPADAVTRETIKDIQVRLHRVKGEPKTDRLTDERLGVQFEQEMRPVAELVGLPESALPEEIDARGGRTPSV